LSALQGFFSSSDFLSAALLAAGVALTETGAGFSLDAGFFFFWAKEKTAKRTTSTMTADLRTCDLQEET
jgi:hypothetical protein